MQSVNSESLDRLYRVILQLKSIEECYDFFEDLCTIKELRDLSQRLDVAFLLDRAELSGRRRGDRGQLRHHLPGKKMPGLRQRRLSPGH